MSNDKIVGINENTLKKNPDKTCDCHITLNEKLFIYIMSKESYF